MANITTRRDEGMTSWDSPRWDPFRLINEMMSWQPLPSLMSMRGTAFAPDFEVRETDRAYEIVADLPGVKEEDLDITVSGNQLTVSGRREASHEEKNERLYTYERRFGSFSRAFVLPPEAQMDQIDADLSDGVLTIEVPKRPDVQPRRISLRERMRRALGGEKDEGERGEAGSRAKASQGSGQSTTPHGVSENAESTTTRGGMTGRSEETQQSSSR